MTTKLKRACMYCGKSMGEKDGEGQEGTSHSICQSCWYENCPGLYPDDESEQTLAVLQVIEKRAEWERSLLGLGQNTRPGYVCGHIRDFEEGTAKCDLDNSVCWRARDMGCGIYNSAIREVAGLVGPGERRGEK